MAIVVMTGGTSGFGLKCAHQLLGKNGTRLIMGGRSSGPIGAMMFPLDLTRLADVRSFATQVIEVLGESKIDALIMNAGISLSTIKERSADGFELTFAVNHLAHYLLLRLLLPYLAEGAVVELTTSGTHDPAEKTMLPLPRHADARLLAHPELDRERDSEPRIAGGRAYSTSKLCNLLTARALAASPVAAAKRLRVVSYSPGPTPGTGLLRDSPPLVRAMWSAMGWPVIRHLFPRFSSSHTAAKELMNLVLGVTEIPQGRIYSVLHRNRLDWPQLSELARRDDLMTALWRDSAILVGLSE